MKEVRLNNKTIFVCVFIVLSLFAFSIVSVSAASNTTTVMVMKHLCNANIRNITDFTNLEVNKTPVAALASTVFNCPTVIEPGNVPTTGVSGGNFQYNFSITDSNGTRRGLNVTSFKNAKLCESDIGIDVNGDGIISNSTCLDISSYSFPPVSTGNVTVVETMPPANATFGALRFTPTQLNGNNDNGSFVSLNNNGTIMLNTLNDSDGMIMLHVYNFRTQNSATNSTLNNTNQTHFANVEIMKHLCPVNFTLQDLERIKANKSEVEAFIAGELTCPVILLPSENHTGNINGGNFNFDFSVSDSNGKTLTLNQSVLHSEKICETDAGMDFNNDGSIDATDCADISHHLFSNLSGGIITVRETLSSLNSSLGAVFFTPSVLNTDNGDDDSVSFVSNSDSMIILNSTKDLDGNIMLHVYNFRVSNAIPLNVTNNSEFFCNYGGVDCNLISDVAFRGGCRALNFSTIDGNLGLLLCKRDHIDYDLYRRSVPGNKDFVACFGRGCVTNNNNFVSFKFNFGSNFNAAGDVLVSDQFNNRVVEINPDTRKIVWSFGSNDPSLCNPGNGTIIGTNWAERISQGLTVIAGTGIPAGVIPEMPEGCADNRVIVVNQNGDIVWQYGQAGISGNNSNELNVPVSAIQLPNKDFLITDQGNNRIIEVNRDKQVVWSYGPTSGLGALNSPNSAELLGNGHILIADENNNRVIEIDKMGKIVWEYDASGAIAFASRLSNGNTLITDAEDARIFTVTPQKNLVSEYFTNTANDSNPNPLPTNAVKLKNGNIIIADQFNHRVFAINSQKQIVWRYGMTNVSGNGAGMLYGPYTAFVVGDYTGQTVPPRNSGII